MEQDPKTAFFTFLGYPLTILHTAYRKQFYPKPMVLMESRDSEGVPFASLDWRVCDQAFGRYRPLTGAEKWSRDHHENLHIGTRRKIHWSQKCYSFRSATKSHQYIRLVITCSCSISYSYPLVHLLWCQRGWVDKLLAHSTCMLWWRFYFSCLSSFTQLLHRSDLCRFTLRSAWSTVSMFFYLFLFRLSQCTVWYITQ